MDFPRKKRRLDPLGHALFNERVQMGMEHLKEAMGQPHGYTSFARRSQHWIITGVGSSEAHAKFLSYLINTHTAYTAEFWPLSHFIDLPPHTRNAGLVVFSQGLSSNAQLAINQREAFEQCVLFSAISKKTAADDKKMLLQKLEQDNVQHVSFTPDNEYSLLIRVAGPLTAYFACIEWTQKALRGNVPPCPDFFFDALSESRLRGKHLANRALLRLLKQGSFLLTRSPLSLFSQNLAYKLTEGIFVRAPQRYDILSFSHGPFQALCAQPAYGFVLLQDTPQDKQLVEKAKPLLEQGTSHYFLYEAKLPEPWSIFEYEMLFNGLLEAALPLSRADQRNWPGKGLDGTLYDLHSITSCL